MSSRGRAGPPQGPGRVARVAPTRRMPLVSQGWTVPSVAQGVLAVGDRSGTVELGPSGVLQHLVVRHPMVRQHAEQNQRVGAAVMLDDIDVGVHAKHAFHALRQAIMAISNRQSEQDVAPSTPY